MRRRYVWTLVVMLVATLMLAACGSNSTPAASPSGTSTAPAKTAVCNGVTGINQALTSLSGVSVNSTVGQVKSAQQRVANRLNAIESRMPSGSGALLSQIKSANDQLATKIQGYPDTTPIGQTSVNIQDLKATVANAQAQTARLATALNCNT